MIDFIIPHMGRVELLQATIDSILTQTRQDLVGSIFVISKNKEPLALPASEKLRVFLRPEAKSISEQRNFGVQQSSAPTLAFLDADIELAPTWVDTCYTLLTNDDSRIVVSAHQLCKRPSNKVEQIRTTLSNVVTDVNVTFLPGRNILCYRKVHDSVGGFPEHLQTCEDYYYTEKLSQHGTLFYTADTYYYHLGEDLSLSQTFKKEIWRSEYNLQSLKGRSVPLREWPSILFPFWITFCLLLSVLTASNLLVSLVMLCAAMIPPLLYSLRLWSKKPEQVGLAYIVIFYSVYFFARSIGTVIGIKHLWLKAPIDKNKVKENQK